MHSARQRSNNCHAECSPARPPGEGRSGRPPSPPHQETTIHTDTLTRPTTDQLTVPREAWTTALETIDILVDTLRALAPAYNTDANLALLRADLIQLKLKRIR